MSIQFNNNQFHLKTKNKSYIFSVYKNKFLTHLYWGEKIENEVDLTSFPDEFIFSRANAFHVPTDSTNNMFVSDLQLEFSVTGNGDYRTPSFLGKYENGSTVTELEFSGYKIYHGKNKLHGLPSTIADDDTDSLEVILTDKLTGLKITLIYSVFEAYDVITRAAVYENTGEEDIHLLSAQSVCVDFYGQDYKIMNLQGDWARERNVEYIDVKHGIFTMNSKRGMSSHMNNPFFALLDKNTSENCGEVYGFCLEYSGNFNTTVEGSSCGTTRVTMGINPYNFDWTLKSNEAFYAPEVMLVHSSNGLGEMSRTYHKMIRERLCRGKFSLKERPLIINNWEGTAFDFDEQKLIDIAKVGANMGLELFVLDDGWFGKRNDDRSSLGDWVVNKEKNPSGLGKLAEKINGMGMKFGLWFEPEMISPDSELYRKNPDWCIYSEGRTRTENRQQLILDLSRKEVREYVVDAIEKILKSANIEYVKWDCNRNITETCNQMQSHKYVLGLYEILEKLTTDFSDILFESCSGGGGRFDAGMLYYMPQTWTSDNTNPMVRVFTQYGTSMVYPPVTMAAHIGSIDVGYERENQYMNTCAMMAMSGNFGYEMDLSKLSKTETEQAKKYVDLYKLIRKTVQFGDFYRLENPFEGDFYSVEFVDNDMVVLFTYQTRTKLNGEERRIKLCGLDKDSQYDINGKIYSGEVLMKLGMRIPLESYDYASKYYILRKVR